MHQFETSTDMFIVAKGECVVNIKDEKGKLVKGHKVLTTSDYFGEIALIYGCKRTASVVSRKYTTLAKLTRKQFKEIVTEFPELVYALKKSIYLYNDRMKRFMRQCLQQIDFFQDLTEDAIHDFIHNMEVKHYSQGDILQKPGDVATELIFLEDGIVEVYAEFDDHNFVIERLFRGSIINYRTWFMDDHA